jgi:uncharacterized membrane protein YeiH
MMILQILDYVGTMAFAVSGALKGVRKELDIFGVVVLAVVTAIGGGTIRDTLLDLPVFWLADSTYVLLSLAMAIGVFVLFRLAQKTERSVLLFDALGLGVFTAIGAMKAAAAGLGIVGMVTMALLTGVGGGVLRDVLAGDVPVVLREEIYASASIAGGLIFALAAHVGLPEAVGVTVAVIITVAIRVVSIYMGWRLPSRPARKEDN